MSQSLKETFTGSNTDMNETYHLNFYLILRNMFPVNSLSKSIFQVQTFKRQRNFHHKFGMPYIQEWYFESVTQTLRKPMSVDVQMIQ